MTPLILINLHQKLIQSLKDKEPDFVKLSNDLTDLTQHQPSGETRMSSNVQQIMSRFESTQLTAKVRSAINDEQRTSESC